MNAFIPQIPAIEEFLQSLSLSQPAEGAANSFQIKFDPSRDRRNNIVDDVVLTIWFSIECQISLGAIRKKLGGVLAGLDHPSEDRVCDILLATFTIIQGQHRGTAIDLLNEMLSYIARADVSQYFAFRIPGPGTFRFEVGGFKVGPTDLFQLSYRSQKAGSDYARLYVDRLRNLPLSISRIAKVKVMAWGSYSEATRSVRYSANDQAMISFLITEYFQAVAQAHFCEFFEDFARVQMIPQALGSGWLSVAALSKLVDAERVAIYENITGQNAGFVAPTSIGQVIDLGGGHIGVPYIAKALDARFGRLGSGPVDAVIRTYCQFLAEAAHLEMEERTADSILYHVIALDLLLGEKGSSTASVTKRSAALTFSAFGRPYSDVLSEADRLYDARSKYVHTGVPPDPILLGVAQNLSREVAFVLFRLRNTELNGDANFRNQWAKLVDLLVAKLNAGVTVSAEDLHRVGAADAGEYSYLVLSQDLSCVPGTEFSASQ